MRKSNWTFALLQSGIRQQTPWGNEEQGWHFLPGSFKQDEFEEDKDKITSSIIEGISMPQ
jgi:hypothetical protein